MVGFAGFRGVGSVHGLRVYRPMIMGACYSPNRKGLGSSPRMKRRTRRLDVIQGVYRGFGMLWKRKKGV